MGRGPLTLKLQAYSHVVLYIIRSVEPVRLESEKLQSLCAHNNDMNIADQVYALDFPLNFKVSGSFFRF